MAGKHYGEGIIKEYSAKLQREVGQKYSVRYLFDIRKLYTFLKVHPVDAQLTMSHYRILFSLRDNNEINYYIDECIKHNYSKRELERIIKSKEYQRLPNKTKDKLIEHENLEIIDFVKEPIILTKKYDYELLSKNHVKE